MANIFRNHDSYTVGVICALPIEKAAVEAMLDEEHPRLARVNGDHNDYMLGKMGAHNVVLACLPAGVIGKASAATVARDMICSFPIKIGLMVGIGGGVWSRDNDVRLGDVIVSQPSGDHGGVIHWGFGKMEKGATFRRTGTLNKPPRVLLIVLASLQSRQILRGSKSNALVSKMITRAPIMARTFAYQGAENDRLF